MGDEKEVVGKVWLKVWDGRGEIIWFKRGWRDPTKEETSREWGGGGGGGGAGVWELEGNSEAATFTSHNHFVTYFFSLVIKRNVPAAAVRL